MMKPVGLWNICLCALVGAVLLICCLSDRMNLRSVASWDQALALPNETVNHGNRYLSSNRYKNCQDSTGSFVVSNNRAVRMYCDDLRRPEYLFACTWSDVRKNCPFSCDSCSNDYYTNDDYGSGYPYDTDDDNSNSRYENNPTNEYTTCRDVQGKFRLKRYGEFIQCHMLRSRAYSDKCAWTRIQRKCPVTCNVPCNRNQNYNNDYFRSNTNYFRGQVRGQTNTVANQGRTGQITNRNRVRGNSPFHDDDDFIDYLGGSVCRDTQTSFQLYKNGRRITCNDLNRSEYALACTWDNIKKLCPQTCNEC